MTHHDRTKILFALLAILAALYAANIFFTKSVYAILVGAPARVSFSIIEAPDSKCENCFNAGSIVDMIDRAHDIKYKTRNIQYGNALSEKYIEMYNIRNLPAIIVSGDIENEKVVSAWRAMSGEEREGRIVIENLLPYYDIESEEVRGVVKAVLLKDKTCGNCFDENGYINILKRFGVVVGDKIVYDIASPEGESLVRKYNIAKVPALILSSDARDYEALFSSWKEVGTVEEDGWFVFREVQKLSPDFKSI